MNSQLQSLMAQMESWEAANEFGIPAISWVDYDARKRSDDLYISCLANIFDALRIDDDATRVVELDSLAKTLVIYSRSAAAQYLDGIERTLNQLYSAALYYLADRPATAHFLARGLVLVGETLEEEAFLRDFLAHDLNSTQASTAELGAFMQSGDGARLGKLIEDFTTRRKAGLVEDPRKFIAASFTTFALRRFAQTNVWKNLQQYAGSAAPELWRPFFFNTRSFPLWELLPSQITALAGGLLGTETSAVSLQMPTSAGKTSLCELLIFDEVKGRSRRVLFLVPFRALAAEIAAGMSGRLEAAGIEIIASYGGNLPTRSETTTLETANVLIVTPEKFAALTQVVPDLDKKFETVICDEGHLIDDDSRGLAYELLLTKLRSSPGVKRKMVFISAILPNVADIHAWLGGSAKTLARSNYKPVDIDCAFLKVEGDGKRWMLDVNPIFPRPRSYSLKDFLTADDFRFINPVTERSNLIGNWKSIGSVTCASALRARRNGAVAVFTTTRGDQGIGGLARKFLEFCDQGAAVAQNSLPLSTRASLVQEYAKFILGADYTLTRLLPHGIGFHHGGLPQEIRRTMEESIADRAITILLCTNTLAEGVNLPIRTLVVHTFKRYNEAQQATVSIPSRNIKNIIGRVGRAGKETRGRIVFANEGDRATVIAVLKDVGLEPAVGRLYRLIERIEEHFRLHSAKLTNSALEQQQPWFLALIDSIDHAIIDLVPEGTTSEQITASIDELLDRTLAKHQAKSDAFRKTLHAVFRLRGDHLQNTIPRESWPVLKKSGASPRFWTTVTQAQLLASPLWQTLDAPRDPEWRDQVVLPLLNLNAGQNAINSDFLMSVVGDWLAGRTYVEIAKTTKHSIDDVLGAMCEEVGFRLQDSVSKLTQLALAQHGEKNISETAQAWPSLLQYGLSTLQQLDLCERGATDRLAVWGVQRFLDAEQVVLRGSQLVRYLRRNGSALREALAGDQRVPQLCAERVLSELRIR